MGGGVSDICKLTVYMTDLGFRNPVYAAIERWLAGTTVCRTGMVVSSLGPPEMLVEIDAFAVIGG